MFLYTAKYWFGTIIVWALILYALLGGFFKRGLFTVYGPFLRFALVQPNMNAPPQFDAADVLQQEERPLDLAEFTQGYSQAVLTWIGTEFAQHQRCRY